MANPDDRYLIRVGEAHARTALELALERAQAIRVPLEMPAARPSVGGDLVEVVRSFAYKLNVGNYESRDFFCSQKITCKASEAEFASDGAYQFCEAEVLQSVKEYKNKREKQAAKALGGAA